MTPSRGEAMAPAVIAEATVPACTRVVGPGSVWVFDDALGRYLRTPRSEAPRERAEWGDHRAGPCQDFVWHDVSEWWITDDGQRLMVVPRIWEPFWAPLAAETVETCFDLGAELHQRRRGPEDAS